MEIQNEVEKSCGVEIKTMDIAVGELQRSFKRNTERRIRIKQPMWSQKKKVMDIYNKYKRSRY